MLVAPKSLPDAGFRAFFEQCKVLQMRVQQISETPFMRVSIFPVTSVN